ncbi:MAG TPA: zinc ribbon domain-containing protein [Vicinamibacterales bacterium]
MSSRTSTRSPAPAPGTAADSGFRAWHLYALLSMVAATAAVIVSRQTHPVALLVLSGAVMASGLVGLTVHSALTGFAGGGEDSAGAVGDRQREALLRDKTLLLRSIKELEFDRATGKVSEADFREMNARLRARALSLMEALERGTAAAPMKVRPAAAAPAVPACPGCGTRNDTDSRFCKHCGRRL